MASTKEQMDRLRRETMARSSKNPLISLIELETMNSLTTRTRRSKITATKSMLFVDRLST